MTSNLACIGLAAEDEAAVRALVARILPYAYPLGTVDGVAVHHWEDPSGARLILGLDGSGTLVDFLPSFASGADVSLVDCRAVNDDVVVGAVADDEGGEMLQLAFELEQRRAMRPGQVWSGTAAVTAFASSAELFTNGDEFILSRASLVDPNTGPDESPPEEYVESGWVWPPRMAEESWLPWGSFGEDDAAVARSRLNGVVVDAWRRRNVLTKQLFLAARVRCLGFEVDLVTAWDEKDDPPAAGSIVAAEVFLVASIGSLEFADDSRPTRRRRRIPFGRRLR